MEPRKVVNDVAEVIGTANELMRDVTKFVQENIVKVDVKFTEGPMIKEGRKVVADGLRNLAKLVENPGQEIKWVDVKKDKGKK